MQRLALCIWAAMVIAMSFAASARAAGEGEYRISGPFVHDNLTVFLIHGPDRVPSVAFMTLQDAMDQKKIIVHETGAVNQLAVENVGERDVFIQACDIVKGGQQDRTISDDFICPPGFGRMQISSFCVENGRWEQRGTEAVKEFQSSSHALATRGLKMAAKKQANQGQVWQEVSKAQARLGENVGRSVAAPQSASSLQLTLEDKGVQELTAAYHNEMAQVVGEKRDAIGFAFAINGQVNSADVYASHELFRQLWPKMLQAASTEAFAELKKGEAVPEVSADAIAKFMADAAAAKETQRKKVTDRVTTVTRERPTVILFETLDGARGDLWIHRSYLAPETESAKKAAKGTGWLDLSEMPQQRR